MKQLQRTGPKRRRWRRRDWSGAHGIGQERRWGSTEGNFKLEREAKRAGLSGGGNRQRFMPYARSRPAYGAAVQNSRATKRELESERTTPRELTNTDLARTLAERA